MSKCLLIASLLAITSLTQAIYQTNPYHLMNDIASKTFIRLKNEHSKIHQDPDHLRIVVREELFP